MPRGDKSAYTRRSRSGCTGHIEESESEQGHSQEEAERIAWATVKKQEGGGSLSGFYPGKSAKRALLKKRRARKLLASGFRG